MSRLLTRAKRLGLRSHSRTVADALTVPLAWQQPRGPQNAYRIGDRVAFDGRTYRSVIGNNVWSPKAYPPAWKLD
jgi:hypothetical protein